MTFAYLQTSDLALSKHGILRSTCILIEPLLATVSFDQSSYGNFYWRKASENLKVVNFSGVLHFGLCVILLQEKLW